MNIWSKIENLINQILILLMELVSKIVHKLIPAKVHAKIEKFKTTLKSKKFDIKNAPQYLKTKATSSIAILKATKYKETFQTSYNQAMAKYQDSNPDATVSKFKKTLLTPILLLTSWLSGLSTTQSLVLLTFTAASFLSGVQVVFSGKRLVSEHIEANREPASVEEVVPYERPEYYKKQNRHFEVNSLRLPVYVGEVNEIKSIDIDFIATLSNREAKMYMEKHDFHFRDHLISEVEPMLATFPLEDEGKDILRNKLEKEINAYLKKQGVEGWVTDLKLTYILAN